MYALEPTSSGGCRTISLREGETTVGRPDLGTLDVKVALTVHREHATFTCGPHSVTMVSRGKNPTGIRRSGDASWRWLAMRDQAELAPGDEVAFSNKNAEQRTLTTFGLRTGTAAGPIIKHEPVVKPEPVLKPEPAGASPVTHAGSSGRRLPASLLVASLSTVTSTRHCTGV